MRDAVSSMNERRCAMRRVSVWTGVVTTDLVPVLNECTGFISMGITQYVITSYSFCASLRYGVVLTMCSLYCLLSFSGGRFFQSVARIGKFAIHDDDCESYARSNQHSVHTKQAQDSAKTPNCGVLY